MITTLDIAPTLALPALAAMAGIFSRVFGGRLTPGEFHDLVIDGDGKKVLEAIGRDRSLLDAPDACGATPVMIAIAYCHNDLARALVELGARLDVEDEDGNTPLGKAAAEGLTDLVELMLARGADPDGSDTVGLPTPLHLAAEWGGPETIRLLVEHGAEIDSIREDSEETPLMNALSWGKFDSAMLLLELGADPFVGDEEGGLILGIALMRRGASMIEPLLAAGVKIPEDPAKRFELIALAAIGMSIECLEHLVRLGLEVNVVDPESGMTPLHRAARTQGGEYDRAMTDRLLAAGIELDRPDARGRTALHLAIAHHDSHNPEMARHLIELGASVSAVDAEGNTPLHVAASQVSEMAAALLLDHGADVDPVNAAGLTPLLIAAAKERVEVVRLLAARGAEIGRVDREWRTPLHHAVLVGNPAMIATLIAAGADRSARDVQGATPLEAGRRNRNHQWMRISEARRREILLSLDPESPRA